MGVVNVTPDSFSDGGRYSTSRPRCAGPANARRRGRPDRRGWRVDPPGRRRVDADQESERVVPVIRELAAAGSRSGGHLPRRRGRGRAGRRGGGGQRRLRRPGRSGMAAVVRDAGARGSSCTGAGTARGCSSWPSTTTWSPTWSANCGAGGRGHRGRGRAERLVIDPGLGFAKTAEHNWELLAASRPVRRDRAAGAGRRVAQIVPGRLLADPDGAPRPVDDREDATTAITAYAALHGAWGVRVHEVRAVRSTPRLAMAASDSAGERRLTDRIALTGLRVLGFHGVFEFERREGQDFVVDVELELDTAAAAATDESPTPCTTGSWPSGWPR